MSQPWDIPLFGEPEPVAGAVTWVLSERDKEEAARPRWLRYRGPAVPCAKTSPDPRRRCRPVTWLLVHGGKETALCSMHKQEHLDRQTLDTPRGSK